MLMRSCCQYAMTELVHGRIPRCDLDGVRTRDRCGVLCYGTAPTSPPSCCAAGSPATARGLVAVESRDRDACIRHCAHSAHRGYLIKGDNRTWLASNEVLPGRCQRFRVPLWQATGHPPRLGRLTTTVFGSGPNEMRAPPSAACGRATSTFRRSSASNTTIAGMQPEFLPHICHKPKRTEDNGGFLRVSEDRQNVAKTAPKGAAARGLCALSVRRSGPWSEVRSAPPVRWSLRAPR
jgi:hypothetical protein